jgi:uncharacterized cupredoxin-like copper-binding protein
MRNAKYVCGYVHARMRRERRFVTLIVKGDTISMNTRRLRSLLPALAIASLALGACNPQPQALPAQPAQPAIVEITLKGHDFSYDAPDQIAAGPVTLKFDNAGKEVHHAQLVRLNDGVTMEQFEATLKKSETDSFALAAFAGGPGAVMPNQSSTVTLDLTQGQYALVCYFTSDDGTPHYAKGMLKPLTVAAAGQTRPPEPKADLTIAMKDFHFDMPSEIKAGRQVWKIVNDGPQPHELQVLKLAPDKTMDDLTAFFETQGPPSGPPPFDTMGGMQGLNTGMSGWLNLDLTPGTYVAICYIPDPPTGKPHFALGMAMPFTVK